ncbi:MAG: hypothetical protein AAB074_08515 [Planctomycetota bacterium]
MLVFALTAITGCASRNHGDPPSSQQEEFPAAPEAESVVKAAPRPRIRYIGGSPEAAMIAVRVKVDGAWKERKYVVLRHDSARRRSGEIGKLETAQDPATGLRTGTDFRTGLVLIGIRKERYRFKRLVRRNDRPGDRVVRDSRDRYRITCLAEDGSIRRWWIEDEVK